MKRILLALAVGLLSAHAFAQTQFPANTLWGNITTSSGLPTTVLVPPCPSGALNYTPGTGLGCGSGGGGITSITSTGSTLLPTGTTTVNLELNLAHSNTWTVSQAVTGTFSVGTQVALGSTFSVSSNTSPWSGAISGANNQLQMIAADGNEAAASLDSFGNLSLFALRRANGTAAAATAVNANDVIGGLFSYAWRTASSNGYNVGSAVALVANENQTSSAGGHRISFFTEANGTTAFLEKMRLNASGGLSIGNANILTDPGSGALFASAASIGTVLALNTVVVITQNPTQVDPVPGLGGNSLLHLVGPNGGATNMVFDAFGAIPLSGWRRANGTAAAKTALNLNDVMVAWAGFGYDGVAYAETAAIVSVASENWNNAGPARGTYLGFYSTTTGTSSLHESMRVQPSSGVSIGAGNVATDPGSGVLSAIAVLTVPTTVASVGTCNAAAKGTRKFVTDVTGTPTWHQTLPAGGSTGNYGVICDGTNWYIQ